MLGLPSLRVSARAEHLSAAVLIGLLTATSVTCTHDFEALLDDRPADATSSSSGDAYGGGSSTASSASSRASAGGASATGGGGSGGEPIGGNDAGGSGGSGGGTAVEVPCGAATCTSPAICCFTDQHTPRTAQSCTQPAACDGVPIACDSPADCPSEQVCCGAFDYGNDLYVSIECKPTCDGADEIELCDLAQPVCKFGGGCLASDNLGPPYGYCG